MDKDSSRRLEALLEQVARPARYTGGEVNQVVKEHRPGVTRFLFAFPDTYEVAMSHLGMKVLYDAVNREEDLGDEGMRVAKMSYHPVGFLKKYTLSWFPD